MKFIQNLNRSWRSVWGIFFQVQENELYTICRHRSTLLRSAFKHKNTHISNICLPRSHKYAQGDAISRRHLGTQFWHHRNPCANCLFSHSGHVLPNLTHLPLVPHTCVSEEDQHWFRKWLVAYSAPSHYLNQCWVIVNWTLWNKLQWNFNQNTKLFIPENASENIDCEMAAILSRPQCVKHCVCGGIL